MIRKQPQIIFYLVLFLLTFVACNDDESYNGDSLVGKWDVDRYYVFYNSDTGSDTIYNEKCDFEFFSNGLMIQSCPNSDDTLSWFFREEPPKVILLDESSVFSDLNSYDVIDFTQDYQEWEEFVESTFEREDREDLITSHYRNIKLTRK